MPDDQEVSARRRFAELPLGDLPVRPVDADADDVDQQAAAVRDLVERGPRDSRRWAESACSGWTAIARIEPLSDRAGAGAHGQGPRRTRRGAMAGTGARTVPARPLAGRCPRPRRPPHPGTSVGLDGVTERADGQVVDRDEPDPTVDQPACGVRLEGEEVTGEVRAGPQIGVPRLEQQPRLAGRDRQAVEIRGPDGLAQRRGIHDERRAHAGVEGDVLGGGRTLDEVAGRVDMGPRVDTHVEPADVADVAARHRGREFPVVGGVAGEHGRVLRDGDADIEPVHANLRCAAERAASLDDAPAAGPVTGLQPGEHSPRGCVGRA